MQIKLGTVTVHLYNGRVFTLDELPPRAIALDGAVQGPLNDDEGRWSFDHHSGCKRLFTLATCQQVWLALSLGFDIEGRDVFVNELDGDTLLSLYLLAHPEYAQGQDTNMRTMVHAVGMIDSHGPAAFRLLDPVSERFWAEGFYDAFKEYSRPGAIAHRFEEWPAMIDAAMLTIWDVYTGKHIKPASSFSDTPVREVLSLDGKMVIAEADGLGGFETLYRRYPVVVLFAPAADGSRRYTVGKISDLVPYHLGPGNDPNSLLGRLNAIEAGWGGGSSIGGSPRLDGGVSSRLTPDEVWTVMQKIASK